MLKKKVLKRIGIIVFSIIVIQILAIYPKVDDNYTITDTNNKGIIYLLDDNNYVARLEVIYNSNNNIDLIKEMISLMTINDSSNVKIRQGFYPIIPKDTKLINCEIDDTTAILNFSNNILSISEVLEEKMIESIVYSVTSINGISSVIIQVENQTLNKLPHSLKSLPQVIDRSYKINKEYDITSFNNVTSTTIYYLAKKNDYIYYIPVTKYTNKENEKIEIIIDELKSSTTYNPNLVSYINEETQLINYELIDKSFLLNFNEQIFSDINSNNIIEEITYAINLSIKNSYEDIESVMYLVNDNIVSNYFLLLG